MDSNSENGNQPQENKEKTSQPKKSIWWLILGIGCMIVDAWLFKSMNFASSQFGTMFFVGLGFIIYYCS